MRMMRWSVAGVLSAVVMMSGCAARPYPPPPPPPPPAYNGVPLLVERAEHTGFRAGLDDGARDAAEGFGYHPRHDRKYHVTPGYDPALGPYGPYRDYFRNAYLRGYYKGFYRQQ